MKPRRKNPTRRPSVPSDATGEDIRTLAEGGYEDGDYGPHALVVFDWGDEIRVVEIVRGKWVVATYHHTEWGARHAPVTRATFSTRDRAFHYARRTGYTYEAAHGIAPSVRNPDWRAIGASAKDKAKRAHEWSKPHAAKAWEATKSVARKAGAATKRGAKKAAPHVARGIRSVSERLDRWAVANPDIGDAEIRRRVASEASTMREHRSMATAYRSEVERALVRRNRMMADFYARMADAHSSMARALAGVASARRAR